MSALESVAPTNIRRSTKVYSYEEEKWDIQMKQEAEHRQKQQLLQNSDIVQLLHSGNVSKKLRELIEAELVKEKDIRSNMLKVGQCIACVCMCFVWCSICCIYVYYYYIAVFSEGKTFRYLCRLTANS